MLDKLINKAPFLPCEHFYSPSGSSLVGTDFCGPPYMSFCKLTVSLDLESLLQNGCAAFALLRMWSRMDMNAENNKCRPTCGNAHEKEHVDSPPGLARTPSPLLPHFPALDWIGAKQILLSCVLPPFGLDPFH